MTVDLLAQVRAEIDARMADLRPAVDEYQRLLGAADALAADADAHNAGVAAGERAPKKAGEPVRASADAKTSGPVGAEVAASERVSAHDAATDRASSHAAAAGPGSADVAASERGSADAVAAGPASGDDAAIDPASGEDAAIDPASGEDAATDRATPARRRGSRGSAAGARSAPPGVTEQAIVAALEHGSHTVGELVLVTAISAPKIRVGVRNLQRARTVTPTKRDGRAAYALTSAAAD